MAHIARIAQGGKLLPNIVSLIATGKIPMPDKENKPRQIVMRFDARVTNLQAVKKAAYKYLNSFSADISINDNEILCSLTFTAPANEELSIRLIEDFKKEVLDQDLREQIKAETEPIRNLIFALAFSKTGIVGNEQVPRD